MMVLDYVDLASVPAEHLTSLATCVTKVVIIRDVSNCDLVSILDNLKCKELKIRNQVLGTEETWAVVRAMETRVETVGLGCMDISALTQYSGQGKCRQVTFYDDAAHKYGEEVRSWAQRINWRVNDFFIFDKKSTYIIR